MVEVKLKVPLTKEENEVYRRYFKALDPDRTNVVTADVAKPFLEQTGLSGRQLGQIWSLVDLDGKGFLIFKEFCALIRCISHLSATPSVPITSSLYDFPVTKIVQFNLPDNNSNNRQRHRRSDNIKSVPLPLISNSDVSRFSQLFDRTTAGQQLLPGDKARAIFIKANLPTDVLGDIWFLCDREQDGFLNKYEFIMAMHLIGLRLSQNPLMDPVPKKISRKLWVSTGLPTSNSTLQSSRSSTPITTITTTSSSSPSSLNSSSAAPNSPSRSSSHRSVTSTSRRSSRHYSPTLSNNSSQRTESPVITRTISGSSISSRNSNNNAFLSPFTPLVSLSENSWEIQSNQYKSFQNTFASLDRNKAKELGPHILVPFFMKSGLTRDTLANVWDLVDMNKTGTLNKKEFIIAMFLIQRVRVTRTNLPYKLPHELLESVEKLAKKYAESATLCMGKETTSGLGITLSNIQTNSSIEKKLKEAEQEQTKTMKEIEIKKQNISKLKEQIEEANKQLEEISITESQCKSQLHKLEEIEDSLVSKLNGINDSIQQSTARIAKMEQTIATTKKNSEQLKRQLAVAEGNYHAMEAKLTILDEEVKDCDEQNEKVKKDIYTMKSTTTILQPKIKAKEEEVKAKVELLNQSKKDFEIEEITVENLRKELENLNNIFKEYEEKVVNN
ncbi:uncharacterized protein PWA37_003620 [Arxiozyma heterogenica]|uniref:Uncharacterized protein n=1 Tax=Arxiozyma heterogenica TaxID=278026 RepID=A0AAN7ZT24_9SACH|nr:hypothetical protein RI543_001016 [Kazachstania heterogenica]